ncbi:MAG: hypothetical protein EOO38_26780 [Cytophagaceae bacterium]|nr:MAG: hypothetical protein EOO38_26780 [Cytophagaceae bacterium]
MKLLVAVCFTLFIGVVNAADNPVLRTDTLTLVFTPEWRFTLEPQRSEGHGPDGEFVIMNYRTLLPDAPPDVVEHHWKTIRGFATEKMPGIAASHGKQVHRPLTETALPDGRISFSTISQSKKMFKDYYFLQYLLGSRRSLVYITVEGYGRAEQAAARFEGILATQQWNE